MAAATVEQCKLCGGESAVCSHIIPRFVFRWMRRTSGGQPLRFAFNPNIKMQDGVKKYLLGRNCEQIFSGLERYFSEEIFAKYLQGNNVRAIPYDERLLKFLVSVLWRVLVVELGQVITDDGKRFMGNFVEAEEIWRNFLLGNGELDRYSEIHLFLTDLLESERVPVVNLNRYLTRAVDFALAAGRSRCFVYGKFSRFVVVGHMAGMEPGKWVGTKIINGDGVIRVPQEVNDGEFGTFMVQRAQIAHEMIAKRTSERQRKIIARDTEKNFRQIIGSDFGKALAADFEVQVDPHMLRSKISRNELCPCGSGNKYKYCHGR